MRVSDLDAPGTARTSGLFGDTPWAVLVGIQDPALLREAESCCERLLVIQPNSRYAERLREEWPNGLPPGLQLCPTLVGPQGMEVPWYCYNDPRLDGPLSPQELRGRHPNLTLRGEELRHQQTLDEIFQDWWGQQTPPQPESGLLLLQADDAAPVLDGASSLLTHLGSLVCWAERGGKKEPAPLAQDLAYRLEEACFRRSQQDPSRWKRDERKLLQRQLEQAQAERARLSAECQAQSLSLQAKDSEKESLLASIRAVESQRDLLMTECQAMQEICVEAQRHTEELENRYRLLEKQLNEYQIRERNQQQKSHTSSLQQEELLDSIKSLELSLHQLRGRNSALESERDHLVQKDADQKDALALALQQSDALDRQVQERELECATLQSLLEGMQGQLESLEREQLSLGAAHDLAIQQRDDLNARLLHSEERSTNLQNDTQTLQAQSSALQQECENLRAAHDLAIQQRDELHAQLLDRAEQGASLLNQSQALQDRFDGLERDHQTLQAQSSALQQECDSFHAAHDLAVQQRDQLDAQVRLLTIENEDLRRRELELARLTEDSEQQLALIRDLFVQVSTARSTSP